MEIIGTPIRGIFRDVLKGSNNDVIYDSGWVSNTIVDKCRVLLAGFMKNDSSAVGIQYLAVGKGRESWDVEGPPDPNTTIINLEDQYEPTIPVTDSEHFKIVYLNEHDAEVAIPTSQLQVTVTLMPGYPKPLPTLKAYPLREFGLLGELNSKNYMINYIRHPVIHKDKSATLVRVVRMYF